GYTPWTRTFGRHTYTTIHLSRQTAKPMPVCLVLLCQQSDTLWRDHMYSLCTGMPRRLAQVPLQGCGEGTVGARGAAVATAAGSLAGTGWQGAPPGRSGTRSLGVAGAVFLATVVPQWPTRKGG